MDRGLARWWLMAVVALGTWAPAAAESLDGVDETALTIAAARADHQPLLVVVRGEDDTQAIDLGIWLREDAQLGHPIQGMHVLLLWRHQPAAKQFTPPEMNEGMGGSWIMRLRPADGEHAGRLLSALPSLRAHYREDLAAISAGRVLSSIPMTMPKEEETAFQLVGQNMDRPDAVATASLKRIASGQLNHQPSADQVGLLDYLVYMLDDGELRQQLQERLPGVTHTHDVIGCELDLADEALSAMDRVRAQHLYGLVAAESHEAPVLAAAARAMWALTTEASSPVHQAWEERQAKDVCVVVEDLAGFVAAISHWNAQSYFPVLFNDDRFAPRFIGSFRPSRVIHLPALGGHVDESGLRRALLSAWSGSGPALDDTALKAQLTRLGVQAHGAVITGADQEGCAGALALAAGRFQGLSFWHQHFTNPTAESDRHPADGPTTELTQADALHSAQAMDGLLDGWVEPGPAWRYLTLAGAYPLRYLGDQEYGDSHQAFDDLIGRDADFTRTAVVGRLVGSQVECAYQAMCSLFLQPANALLFDTYNQNPFGGYGDERLEPFAHLTAGRVHCDWLVKREVDDFRMRSQPWSPYDLLLVATAGGPDWWFVGANRGTSEDMPMGTPSLVTFYHSYSAANPYDPDTLAGRLLWGGSYFFFGSCSEPLVGSFQNPRWVGARMLQGLPLGAALRAHAGEDKARPWRLLLVGDPQMCLRQRPLARSVIGSDFLIDASETIPLSTSVDPIERLRCCRLLNDQIQEHTALSHFDDAKDLSPSALILVLESCCHFDDCPRARGLWHSADAQCRANPEVRRLARYCLGVQLDRSWQTGNLDLYHQLWRECLETQPQGEYRERTLARGCALATAQQREQAWYDLLAGDVGSVPAEVGSGISALLTRHRLDTLLRQAHWDESQSASALPAILAVAALTTDAHQLSALLDRAGMRWNLHGATGPDGLEAALREAQKPLGTVLGNALKEITDQRSFFRDWLILGPFPNSAHGSWDALEAAANPIDLAQTFTDDHITRSWIRPFRGSDYGAVDLIQVLGLREQVHAYACARINTAVDCSGYLQVGSDDGVTIWLDGKQIHRHLIERAMVADDDHVALRIPKGRHWLLLRIDQNIGGWGFCLRFTKDALAKQPLAVMLENPRESKPAVSSDIVP